MRERVRRGDRRRHYPGKRNRDEKPRPQLPVPWTNVRWAAVHSSSSFRFRSEEVALLGVAMACGVANFEPHVEWRFFDRVRRNCERNGHGEHFAWRSVHRRRSFEARLRALSLRSHRQRERLRLLRLVHDLQRVIVADRVAIGMKEFAAVANDVDADQRTREQCKAERDAHRRQRDCVADHARPQYTRRLSFELVVRRVADEPRRVADLLHHVVAGVDAVRAADALVLQTVPDVDAGRAHLHAQLAVDAVAAGLRAGVERLRAPRGSPRAGSYDTISVSLSNIADWKRAYGHM